jgi:hypothetical protein
MNAAGIVNYLSGRGFHLSVDRSDLLVSPKIADVALRDRVIARKPDILAFLREHGGEWPPQPASAHRFVLWSGAKAPQLAACVACGVPVEMHGDDPLADALIVDEVNEVALVTAVAIVRGVLH